MEGEELPAALLQGAGNAPRAAWASDSDLEEPEHHQSPKWFNDAIHGHMCLDPLFVKFIDTPEFQRLRYLAQLGVTSQVFPCATHTRFEHSLGVCYLAFQYVHQLWAGRAMHRRKGSSSLHDSMDIRGRDMLMVGLAGLCHDMGHGPYSHTWEAVCAARGVTHWHHEHMSCKLFDHIRDENHIDLSEDEAKLVKQLILGERPPDGKGFLRDIVANHRNSIDVDKIDYIPRDAKYCHVNISCDLQRLMSFTKVINDEICYKWSEYHNVGELFHSRQMLHKTVYTHRKAKAIELMVMDALVLADEALGLTRDMEEVNHFNKLDDTLIRRIEFYEDYHPKHPALDQAQALVKRLRKREIYKHVNEGVVPVARVAQWKPLTSEELVSHWHGDGLTHLDKDKVVVNVNRINWAMKDKNPLDNVNWFTHFSDTEPIPDRLKSSQMTSFMTPNFEETMVRIFSKDRDPRVVDALNSAFHSYWRKTFGQAGLATPSRGKGATTTLQRLSMQEEGVVLQPPMQEEGELAVQQEHLNASPSGAPPSAKRNIGGALALAQDA